MALYDDEVQLSSSRPFSMHDSLADKFLAADPSDQKGYGLDDEGTDGGRSGDGQHEDYHEMGFHNTPPVMGRSGNSTTGTPFVPNHEDRASTFLRELTTPLKLQQSHSQIHSPSLRFSLQGDPSQTHHCGNQHDHLHHLPHDDSHDMPPTFDEVTSGSHSLHHHQQYAAYNNTMQAGTPPTPSKLFGHSPNDSQTAYRLADPKGFALPSRRHQATMGRGRLFSQNATPHHGDPYHANEGSLSSLVQPTQQQRSNTQLLCGRNKKSLPSMEELILEAESGAGDALQENGSFPATNGAAGGAMNRTSSKSHFANNRRATNTTDRHTPGTIFSLEDDEHGVHGLDDHQPVFGITPTTAVVGASPCVDIVVKVMKQSGRHPSDFQQQPLQQTTAETSPSLQPTTNSNMWSQLVSPNITDLGSGAPTRALTPPGTLTSGTPPVVFQSPPWLHTDLNFHVDPPLGINYPDSTFQLHSRSAGSEHGSVSAFLHNQNDEQHDEEYLEHVQQLNGTAVGDVHGSPTQHKSMHRRTRSDTVVVVAGEASPTTFELLDEEKPPIVKVKTDFRSVFLQMKERKGLGPLTNFYISSPGAQYKSNERNNMALCDEVLRRFSTMVEKKGSTQYRYREAPYPWREYTFALEDDENGVYIADCVGFVYGVLRAVDPEGCFLTMKLHTEKLAPTPSHWFCTFQAIHKQSIAAMADIPNYTKWQPVRDPSDLQPGDIIAWQHYTARTSGHIVIVMPLELEEVDDYIEQANTVGYKTLIGHKESSLLSSGDFDLLQDQLPEDDGGEEWVTVRVADATSAPHSDDTRPTDTTGMGVGWMQFRRHPHPEQDCDAIDTHERRVKYPTTRDIDRSCLETSLQIRWRLTSKGPQKDSVGFACRPLVI